MEYRLKRIVAGCVAGPPVAGAACPRAPGVATTTKAAIHRQIAPRKRVWNRIANRPLPIILESPASADIQAIRIKITPTNGIALGRNYSGFQLLT
jgi:hypothetical protein